MFPALAWAEEADDFGLTEVDPELPQKIVKWNADCLSCHSRQGLTAPPRQGMDMALLAKLLVEQERFEHSYHGKMACKDCHTEAYVPYPHKQNASKQIKGCVECHQNPARTIQPEFKASKHFKEHSDRFSCLSCHDAHTDRKASRLETAHLAAVQDNAMCQSCHDDDTRYMALKLPASTPASSKPVARRPDMAKTHDWLPNSTFTLPRPAASTATAPPPMPARCPMRSRARTRRYAGAKPVTAAIPSWDAAFTNGSCWTSRAARAASPTPPC